jgi:hypothetical protein
MVMTFLRPGLSFWPFLELTFFVVASLSDSSGVLLSLSLIESSLSLHACGGQNSLSLASKSSSSSVTFVFGVVSSLSMVRICFLMIRLSN